MTYVDWVIRRPSGVKICHEHPAGLKFRELRECYQKEEKKKLLVPKIQIEKWEKLLVDFELKRRKTCQLVCDSIGLWRKNERRTRQDRKRKSCFSSFCFRLFFRLLFRPVQSWRGSGSNDPWVREKKVTGEKLTRKSRSASPENNIEKASTESSQARCEPLIITLLPALRIRFPGVKEWYLWNIHSLR